MHIEPEFVEHPGRHPIDEEISVSDQITHRRHVGIEIDCCPAFSGVEVLEQPGPVGVLDTTGKRAPSTQRVAGRRLDLGDLGAQVDEQLRAVRACDVTGDLDDAQTGQRARHAGIPMAFGSMYW